MKITTFKFHFFAGVTILSFSSGISVYDLVELLYALDTCNCISNVGIGRYTLWNLWSGDKELLQRIYEYKASQRWQSHLFSWRTPWKKSISGWWGATWKAASSRSSKSKGRYSDSVISPFIHSLISTSNFLAISSEVGSTYFRIWCIIKK